VIFCFPERFCPSSPQPPSPTRGEGGILGVLMAETGDGTQGLAKKSTPVSMSPTPFSRKGRRRILGVLMPETKDGMQGLAKTSTPCEQDSSLLLLRGEKGEFGRPEAQNERKNREPASGSAYAPGMRTQRECSERVFTPLPGGASPTTADRSTLPAAMSPYRRTPPSTWCSSPLQQSPETPP
jgi:hypothetical protein